MTPDVISSLVNLGSAGAVIIVVIIFLNSMKERDNQWRDFFTDISSSNRKDVDAMRETANHMLTALNSLLSMYSQHDARATTIQATIDAIKHDVSILFEDRRHIVKGAPPEGERRIS